jgi:hypothetical protein
MESFLSPHLVATLAWSFGLFFPIPPNERRARTLCPRIKAERHRQKEMVLTLRKEKIRAPLQIEVRKRPKGNETHASPLPSGLSLSLSLSLFVRVVDMCSVDEARLLGSFSSSCLRARSFESLLSFAFSFDRC